tara:strand:+ start:234 stop:767 length:534 start_codon:yes stop_codon:yes gene_type:complete
MKCDDKCKIGLIVLGVIIVNSIIVILVCNYHKTEIANELDQKYINSSKVEFITTPTCSFSCTGVNSKCYKLYTTKLQLTVYVDVKSLINDFLNIKVNGTYGSNKKITHDISSASNSDCRDTSISKNKENISYTDNTDIIPKINLYEDKCYIKGLSKLSISLTNKDDYKKIEYIKLYL